MPRELGVQPASTDAAFVASAKARGLQNVALAMNGELPDNPTASSPPTYLVGRAENALGQPVVAPWMQTWQHPPSPGCVNKNSYVSIALARVAQLVAAGATSIQHDDPGINAGLATWYQGDPKKSGCYCSKCMHGFTATLMGLNATTRAKLMNLTSDFDYRSVVLASNASTPEVAHELRRRFLLFQADSTAKYARALRQSIPSHVALSCNGGGNWEVPERYLNAYDYGVGELHVANSNPGA